VRGFHGFLEQALVTGAIATACSCSVAESRRLTHRGHDGCVEITTTSTRVVVVPAWAGRLAVVDFGRGNVLHVNKSIDGTVLPPNSGWMHWDGNATDVVRHDRRNQWKGLWLHPWTDVSATGGRVEIASPLRTEAGVSGRKVYELAPDGSSLAYTFTITQESDDVQPWTIWERALVPGGGYVVAPVAKTRTFPRGWIVRDGTTVEPEDRAASAGAFLVVRSGTKKGAGLAARLRPAGGRGWIASIRDRHAFLILWDVAAEGDYPHYDGAHAIFWLAPDTIELEPLSPQVMLRRGTSLALAQTWRGVPIPADVDARDAAAVGAWLERQVTRNAW